MKRQGVFRNLDGVRGKWEGMNEKSESEGERGEDVFGKSGGDDEISIGESERLNGDR